MLLSMLCTCEILELIETVITLILVCAAASTLS